MVEPILAMRRLAGLWSAIAPGRSRYRREVLLSSLTDVIIYGSGLITAPLLTRALGPGGRGEIAAVLAPITVLAALLPLGLPLAAAYFVDEIPERKLLTTTTAFGLVVLGPVCAGLWFLAPFYYANDPGSTLTWARIFLVGLPPTVGITTALEIRRRFTAGTTWNLWRAAPLALPTLAVVVLAAFGALTVDTALATYVLGGSVPFIFLLLRLRGGPIPRPSVAVLRTLLPYAWRTMAFSLATVVTLRIDQVVLAPFVSPDQLGLYAVAVTMASITNPLVSGLTLALFGHLRGEAVAHRAESRFRRSLLATVVLSGSVALLLGAAAPWVLGTVFGSAFSAGATTLRLLLPGAVAFNIRSLLCTRLYAEGRLRYLTRASFLGAGVTVFGLAVLAPTYGIEAAAVVTSLAFIGEVIYLIAHGALGAPKMSSPDLGIASPKAAQEALLPDRVIEVDDVERHPPS